MPRRAALAAAALSSAASAASPTDASPSSSAALVADTARRAADIATAGAGPSTVVFQDARVSVDPPPAPGTPTGTRSRSPQVVPVAVWYPSRDPAPPNAVPAVYPHAISVAKIARVLLGLPPSVPRWLDRECPLAATRGVVARGTNDSRSGSTPPGFEPTTLHAAVVLCHGYLGSRFDLVDLAEALAASGFLVVAPEFAESLANPETVPSYARPGKPPPTNASATRDEIVAATLRDIVRGRFGVDVPGTPGTSADSSGTGTRSSNADAMAPRVAVVGQSAGASTATSTRGSFARVAVAGFRPPSIEETDARRELMRDPLLVVASAGDGVISLYPRASGAFGPYAGIAAEVASLPGPPVPRFDADGLVRVVSSRDRPPPRAAFVTYEPERDSNEASAAGAGAGSGSGSALPCHISFLSSRTNDAMVETLSPLLPLARVLRVPVLDFDVYQTTRDSDAVNAALVPGVVGWLAAVLSRGGEGTAGGTNEGTAGGTSEDAVADANAAAV